MRSEQFAWWVERFRRTLELVDAVRIDHFRGFVAYWSIPERHRTARHGRWRRGPGREVFDAVWRELGPVPVVAENLGVITPAVERLRHEFGMPGCVVLQFLFTENLQNRPPRPTDENVVVYTGTHDNDTTHGWWSGLSPRARERLETELARHGIDERRPSWKLIRLAYASDARLAIVPAQDLLGLGSRARMNFPGRARGSWSWQLQPGMLGADLAAELRDLTESSLRDA
jgi:4-alpha-glucanotransferase